MHRSTSAGAPWRVAIVLAALAVFAPACGDPDDAAVDQAPPSTAEVLDLRTELPIEVSESSHSDVVALGDTGQFVVVDGFSARDAGSEADGTQGTDVWLVSAEEARLVARFEEALLYPNGWLGDDGSVRVLGVPCEEFDAANDARCPDVPVHQLIVTGDTVERRELALRVSTDTGLGVTGTGDEAVLTVGRSVLEDGGDSRFEETAYLLDPDGGLTDIGRAENLGPICSSAERIVMFPSDVNVAAGSSPVIRELRDGELVTVATVESLAEPTAVVFGCDERGHALAGTIGAAVQYRTLAPDGTWSDPTPGVSGPPTFEDGHLMRWDRVEGSSSQSDMNSEFVLSVRRDGAWVEQGRVRSLEEPRDTSISGVVTLALIYQHPRLVLDLVR